MKTEWENEKNTLKKTIESLQEAIARLTEEKNQGKFILDMIISSNISE